MSETQNPYEDAVEISNLADNFKVLAELDGVREQVNSWEAELETLSKDPDCSETKVKSLERAIGINVRLLKQIEEADDEFYKEFDKLKGEA